MYQVGRGSEPMIDVGSITLDEALNMFTSPVRSMRVFAPFYSTGRASRRTGTDAGVSCWQTIAKLLPRALGSRPRPGKILGQLGRKQCPLSEHDETASPWPQRWFALAPWRFPPQPRRHAAADPIRIGLSLSLTGPTAAGGQAGSRRARNLARRRQRQRRPAQPSGGIGLLRRPGAPANAPGIYAKLMSVDKVELLIGPYSTNVIAAAMPAIIQRGRTTIGIFGLGANQQFKYPKYFSMNSQGPSPANYSKCIFDLAAAQNPKPTRVALVGADAEYSRNALDGAKANAKAMGFEIVFERTYPLSTTDYTSIVRAMAATKPDVVLAPRCRSIPSASSRRQPS